MTNTPITAILDQEAYTYGQEDKDLAPPADAGAHTKKLVVIRGKGTAHERRSATDVTLYWHAPWRRWVTIPDKDAD
jgi:hypothetical protein